MDSMAGDVETVVIARREVVATLLARGKTRREIMAVTGQTYKEVRLDCEWIERYWLEQIAERIDYFKARQINRLEHLYAEAVAAWEKSKLDAESKIVRVKKRAAVLDAATLGEPDEVEQVQHTKGQSGNPSFLDAAIKCIQEACKIGGGYAPVQARLVDEDGRDILTRLLPSLELDELRVMDAVFRKIEAIEVEKKGIPAPGGIIEGGAGGNGEGDVPS